MNTVTDFIKSLPLPRRSLRILSLISYVFLWSFLAILFFWMLMIVITNVRYYFLDHFRDDLTSESLLSDTNNATIPITISQPNQIFDVSSPYTITLKSTDDLTQSVTLSISDTKNVLTEPKEMIFTGGAYQIDRLMFKNNLGVQGNGKIILDHNFPNVGPVVIILPKENRIEALQRKFFIVNSLRDGIVPLIIPLIFVVFASMVQKGQQEKIRYLIEQFDREARSFKVHITAYDQLRYHLQHIPAPEAERINNINYFTPEQHIAHLVAGGASQEEHIGRVIASRNKDAVTELEKLGKQDKIKLWPTAGTRVREVLQRAEKNPKFQAPQPLVAESKPGGRFERGTEKAEHDPVDNYNDNALPRPYSLPDLYKAIKPTPYPSLAIYGAAGSGKTALLRRLRYQIIEEGDPFFPALVNMRDARILNSHIVSRRRIKKLILAQTTDLLCDIMRREPREWIDLPNDMQVYLFKDYLRYIPLERVKAFVQQVEQADAEEGWQLRQRLAHHQSVQGYFWRAWRRYGSLNPALRRTIDVVQQLGYTSILLCLDDVLPRLNVAKVAEALAYQDLHMPLLVVAAYASSTTIPKHEDRKDVVALVWSREEIAELLSYRADKKLGQDIIEVISGEAGVARDIWPWWQIFTSVQHEKMASGEEDITAEERAKIVRCMKQARQRRSDIHPLRRWLTGVQSGWTMRDCDEAIKMWQREHHS